MNSDRNAQRLGLVNFFSLLIIGVLSAVIAKKVSSEAGTVAVCFLGFGALVSAVSYFQMRLEARERLEKLEYDELTKAKSASTLFDSTQVESFPARNARVQFERYFVPGFTILLFLLQISAVIYLWQWLKQANWADNPVTFMGMAFFGAFALVLFFLGQYSATRARFENERLLRPGAGYLTLGAIFTAIMASTEILVWAGFPKLDVQFGQGICIVMGLAAAETLFSLVFEIYRPRVKGQAPRLLYESRVVGLLGQPTGLVSTAAQALDYQFGFKVSETWFYKEMREWLPVYILVQFALIWICTCVVFIEPNQQGLLERFGAPQQPLTPGVHFKLPWPIEKVYRYTTTEIQSFTIGVVADEQFERENTLVWTKQHYKEEFNMLVASRQQLSEISTNEQAVPVNLLTVSIPVQFVISNVTDWAYNNADAGQLLERLATREVVNYLVSVDVEDIMAKGRIAAAAELKARIQASAKAQKLGAEIVFVGLQDIHPPVSVAESYEAVNSALQQREGIILSAEGDRAQILPAAAADAKQRVLEAETYRLRKMSDAIAIAGRFTNQLFAYKASPTVFAYRSYLDSLTKAIAPTRKTVLGVTNTDDVIILDLQEKVRQDLLGVNIPEAKK